MNRKERVVNSVNSSNQNNTQEIHNSQTMITLKYKNIQSTILINRKAPKTLIYFQLHKNYTHRKRFLFVNL